MQKLNQFSFVNGLIESVLPNHIVNTSRQGHTQGGLGIKTPLFWSKGAMLLMANIVRQLSSGKKFTLVQINNNNQIL